MKKIKWTILIGLLAVISLNAQEKINDSNKKQLEFRPKNIVKLHPLVALAGVIGIDYERVIKPKKSLNFRLFQQFNEPNFDNNKYERNYNMLFEAELRRYLSKRKNAPEGWSVSGSLMTEYNYNRLEKNSASDEDIERLWVGVFAKTGYQWVFKKALKGITTEVNGGLGYRTTTGIFDEKSLSGLAINLNFTLGYSW